jgi:hypothetical protein
MVSKFFWGVVKHLSGVCVTLTFPGAEDSQSGVPAKQASTSSSPFVSIQDGDKLSNVDAGLYSQRWSAGA